MKKVLSLLLALVICLSLCACGGSSKENAIVGKWVREDGGTVVFNKDKTALVDDFECTWAYNETQNSYTIYLEIPVTFVIETDNDIRYFDAWEIVRYYHADDYKKVATSNN